MHVLVTGAAGNLGSKLISHLQDADWCSGITGIDPKPMESAGKLRAIVGDLRDPTDKRWTAVVGEADAIVHFAAQNPWPDSSWPEAAQSIDMTLNLLNRVGDRPCRFVFASSNHVMGGYKDVPLPAGELLTADTPPMPGTRMFDGRQYITPQAYGGSKLIGERAVMAKATASNGQFTGVNIRIGWVQRGENRPETINANGGGTNHGPGQPDAEEVERAMTWFRGMWLSNRDFAHLLQRALRAPADNWPKRAILVSGVSNNSGTAWSHAAGRDYLDYQPIDDVTK
ncbi:NAD-dependent epimerase/dehydratase family protein [Devosia sp. SL43]|uniref:NAD-dependent epimerase/dehydratase family protein n=1 Tax=Devosia sp. SL43 TaxID=2806348 RepID=UPI001F41A79C|nr:NAD(P)-dependent oxidoreductase [Devosia sp. SL43]UJW86397.1 NAD(P)-dependent oxidoreductase [Devosia sp. SL43]